MSPRSRGSTSAPCSSRPPTSSRPACRCRLPGGAPVGNWARSAGGFVLEDDYDGEFRYDRRSVGALQALAPDAVVYLGSASKALAPAVGLAWAVVPAGLRDELRTQRELAGGAPAGLHQHTLAGFIDSFEYDRAVRRRRARFRTRRELLAALLAERAPGLRIGGLSAGLQCVIGLPDRGREDRALARAHERGVAVEGLSAFRAERRADHDIGPPVEPEAGIVVGYGALPPSRVDAALEALVDAIATAAADGEADGMAHADGA